MPLWASTAPSRACPLSAVGARLACALAPMRIRTALPPSASGRLRGRLRGLRRPHASLRTLIEVYAPTHGGAYPPLQREVSPARLPAPLRTTAMHRESRITDARGFARRRGAVIVHACVGGGKLFWSAPKIPMVNNRWLPTFIKMHKSVHRHMPPCLPG